MSGFASDFTYSAESGESTSAMLRRVEQELAEMREARDVCLDRLDLVKAELASARTELDLVRRDLAHARHERDMAVNNREQILREVAQLRRDRGTP